MTTATIRIPLVSAGLSHARFMRNAAPSHAGRQVLSVSSQDYYWSRAWQQNESEAMSELADGQGKEFASGADAIAWLLGDED